MMMVQKGKGMLSSLNSMFEKSMVDYLNEGNMRIDVWDA